MYKKSIHDINYQKLKTKNIKCIIFDLDNTIALIDQDLITEKTKKLITKLKKDFIVIIISNNYPSRVEPYANVLDCEYISQAKKPLTGGYKKIKEKYNLENEEMCMIGDQIITDILGGNRFKMLTILVDPLGKKDLKITYINRFLEKRILNYFEFKKLMKKGEYYE